MNVSEFVRNVSSVSLPNVFNPYQDTCAISDHPSSAAIRRRNLTLFLEAMVSFPNRSLWLGRDLGYRGGRRTGIALTDEYHLEMLKRTFQVTGIQKATTQVGLTKERTATEVWKMVRMVKRPILLWNAFPFHPYEQNDPMSNRRHTSQEFSSCGHLLSQLIEWLKPSEIIALGADAEAAVRRVGHECQRVRHPSYGGQADFARQILAIYSASTAA